MLFGTISAGQKKVNLFAILACLLGLAAVIVGVTLLNTPTESARDGGGLTFGADFYTEMHGVTRTCSSAPCGFMKPSTWGWALC